VSPKLAKEALVKEIKHLDTRKPSVVAEKSGLLGAIHKKLTLDVSCVCYRRVCSQASYHSPSCALRVTCADQEEGRDLRD
jgi:hypothetical protein